MTLNFWESELSELTANQHRQGTFQCAARPLHTLGTEMGRVKSLYLQPWAILGMYQVPLRVLLVLP
jgi:hypothetical protein